MGAGLHSNDCDKPWTLFVKERDRDWKIAFSGSKGQIGFAFEKEKMARVFTGLRIIDHEGNVMSEEIEGDWK